MDHQKWFFRGACLVLLVVGLMVTTYGEPLGDVVRDPYLYLFSLMLLVLLLPSGYTSSPDSFFGRLINAGPLFVHVLLRRDFFFDCSFNLLGHLCVADGEVNQAIVAYVESFIDNELKLTGRRRDKALRLFKRAMNSGEDPAYYIATFRRIFARQPATLNIFVDMLLRAAAADGRITPAEERLVSSAAVAFGLGKSRYHRLRRQYVQSDYDERLEGSAYHVSNEERGRPSVRPLSPLARAYATLESSPAATPAEIKRNYRRLVREHHPDAAIGRRMSPEQVVLANKKFREIQEAYELVAKEREIK